MATIKEQTEKTEQLKTSLDNKVDSIGNIINTKIKEKPTTLTQVEDVLNRKMLGVGDKIIPDNYQRDEEATDIWSKSIGTGGIRAIDIIDNRLYLSCYGGGVIADTDGNVLMTKSVASNKTNYIFPVGDDKFGVAAYDTNIVNIFSSTGELVTSVNEYIRHGVSAWDKGFALLRRDGNAVAIYDKNSVYKSSYIGESDRPMSELAFNGSKIAATGSTSAYLVDSDMNGKRTYVGFNPWGFGFNQFDEIFLTGSYANVCLIKNGSKLWNRVWSTSSSIGHSDGFQSACCDGYGHGLIPIKKYDRRDGRELLKLSGIKNIGCADKDYLYTYDGEVVTKKVNATGGIIIKTL